MLDVMSIYLKNVTIAPGLPYATQRPTFVFASVVNAAHCNASRG